MGFHPGYQVVQSLDLGVETSSGVDAGIPNPPWERLNLPWGTSGGFATNYADPFTTNFECIGTGTGVSPIIQNVESVLPNGSRPHRISGALRAVDDVSSPSGPILQNTVLSLRYATEGDFRITLTLGSRKTPLTGTLSLGISYASAVTTTTWEVPVVANVFYTVGIENLGRIVNAYLDTAGAADTRLLAGIEGLELVGTMSVPGLFPAVVVRGGLNVGGKFSGIGALGCAIGNVILEELDTTPGSIANPASGISSGWPPGNVIVPPSGMFEFPKTPIDGPALPEALYSRHKSLRKAMLVFNNLDIR